MNFVPVVQKNTDTDIGCQLSLEGWDEYTDRSKRTNGFHSFSPGPENAGYSLGLATDSCWLRV